MVFEIRRMAVLTTIAMNGIGQKVVVTWTPERIISGSGKLTAGKPFLVLVTLRNPAEKKASGKVYLTGDGEKIGESEEIFTISHGGFAGYQRKVTLDKEKSYRLCCIVEEV